MNRPDIEAIREKNEWQRWSSRERQAVVRTLLAYITDLEQYQYLLAECERERDNAWDKYAEVCQEVGDRQAQAANDDAARRALEQRLKECVDDYDTLMREKVECEEQRDDAEEAYKQALDDKAVLRDRLAQAEREEGNHA
jgi:small-conductance mechanosensitive channel